jgi:starvation-inducible outer membrane lipoprotein
MKATNMRVIHLLTASAAMTLSACSHYPSAVDNNFGVSTRQTIDLQSANPDAPLRSHTPMTSDGQSAKAAVDRYQKSFEVLPLPTNVFNIGVGSGTGGAAR